MKLIREWDEIILALLDKYDDGTITAEEELRLIEAEIARRKLFDERERGAVRIAAQLSVPATVEIAQYACTVATPHGTSAEQAVEIGKRLFRKKGVERGSWFAVEQTGTTLETLGQKAHIHALVKTKLQRSVLLQRIQQTNKVPPNLIWVRLCEDVVRYRSYLSGNKGESKRRKVEKDKQWREFHGLDAFYTLD